jgi:hypothetical protein
MKKARLPRSVILVAVLYLVAAISAAVTLQNLEFLKIYIPFFIALAALIAVMHRRVNFSNSLLWSLTILGAMQLAGGLVIIPETWDSDGSNRILNSWWVMGTWLKYDHLMHVFAFGTCTWLTWEALRASIQSRLGRKLYPSMGMIFLCVFTGMGLGALSEVIQHLTFGGGISTYVSQSRDLAANLVGCLFVGVLILFRG